MKKIIIICTICLAFSTFLFNCFSSKISKYEDIISRIVMYDAIPDPDADPIIPALIIK